MAETQIKGVNTEIRDLPPIPTEKAATATQGEAEIPPSALNDAQKMIILDKTLAAIHKARDAIEKNTTGLKRAAVTALFTDFAGKFEDGARYKPAEYYVTVREIQAFINGMVAEVEAAK